MIDRAFSEPAGWEILIIGGGATGVGAALDAAARGYRTLLLEQADFGKGTSGRSTKLIHGGVRYLQQGNIPLVMEALKERGLLRRNAPHLVRDLAFVVPNYDWWEAPFYGLGMKVYDLLAGQYGFGKSRLLSRSDVLERIPTLATNGLRGGVLYYDGQFDDARLLISLARTAADHGATLANYVAVAGLSRDGEGFINGVIARDLESGREQAIGARVVVNATGPFADAIRRMEDPAAPRLIAPSQGIHLVLDRSFLPGSSAIMVPRTSDGRVLFAIPWYGHALLGTTDTPIESAALEPVAMEHEVDFVLETAGQYLHKRPARSDVLSVFAGIRPLVRSDGAARTASLSRDHTIQISRGGLLTIVGGKWTTYRKMSEACIDQAATLARLDERPCSTRALRIHGYSDAPAASGGLGVYGSDAEAIRQLTGERPELAAPLHSALPIIGAQVIFAARCEMARSVDDVLARRTQALQLNARAAVAIAPRVAELMAGELRYDAGWQAEQVRQFSRIARNYII